MNDFRLEVFREVARTLSFTKASKFLFVSQPAISKHIHELESRYGVQLFVRRNNRLEMTEAARTMLRYADTISQNYREMSFEMDLMSRESHGELRIGASSTISQYVIPEILAKFNSRFPDVKLSLSSGNTRQVEQMLQDSVIDVGMIEGARHNRDYHYELFKRDELVLVTSVRTKSPENVDASQLRLLPLVLRERGSGTLEVIEQAMGAIDLKISELNIILYLGSTEGIKSFLQNTASYAIVSIASVFGELSRGELKVVDIQSFTIERDFSFITKVGSSNSNVRNFCEFAKIVR